MTDNDKVPELSKAEFEDFVGEGLVLMDFYASWYMPCLIMAPVLDELSDKFKGKVKFGKISIEENQELAHKFKINSMPNFILFKNGEVLDQFIGAISVEDFSEKLEKYI